MISGQASVAYVLLDKLGGIFSLNSNLIRYKPSWALPQKAVLLVEDGQVDAAATSSLGAETERRVLYDSVENRYAILERLCRAIPRGPGVLVSNDWHDLAACHLYDFDRAVVQIVHDAYNLRLAKAYHLVVDAFVAHSEYFYRQLQEVLPQARDRIHHLPYGIPLASRQRTASNGPLRLVFLGRMTEAKGVFDLPKIDAILSRAGASVSWTLIGEGPDKAVLQAQWTSNAITFLHPRSNAEVLDQLAENDVLVFPTRHEGFPVALLEAMSAGLVPVVSNLPSGVPEVVSGGTGFRRAIADVEGFADAILSLDRDRARLERMSSACRELVAERFDIVDRAAGYHALFSRWQELRRPRLKSYPLPSFSRLDQPWMPNWVVRNIRNAARHVRGTR